MSEGLTTDRTDKDRAFAVALGKRVRLLRRLTRLSPEALAELAGVTPSHLLAVEAGGADVSVVDLRRVCHALGVSDWPVVLRVAEQRVTGARPLTATSVPLHVHVEIHDEQAVTAALAALMTASLSDSDGQP